MAEIFVSHSRHDTAIKAFFSSVFGRTHVRAVLVEYESLGAPPWPEIQGKIYASSAVFVLLGDNVQTLAHTQVWVGSESTYAAAANKDIWVFDPYASVCDVAVLSATDYMLYDQSKNFEDYLCSIIESYDDLPIIHATFAGALHGLALTSNMVQPGAQIGGALVGAIVSGQQAATQRARPMGLPVQCPQPHASIHFAFTTS